MSNESRVRAELECSKKDLNNGKDDESIAGDGGDAEGVEDQRQPESREAGRQLCFHRLSSNVLFTRFLLSCTDLLHVLA